MALVDTLSIKAEPQADIGKEIQGGLQAGIGLATAKEQVELKKIEVAKQKEDLEISQLNSFNGMLKTFHLANPAVAKQMAPKLKERFQQMGFDPAIIDTIQADPEFGRALYNIANTHGSKIANDPAARAQVLRSAQDLGMLSDGLTAMQARDKQEITNTQQTKIEQMGNDSAERIARISAENKTTVADAKIDKETRGALTQANNKFKSEMKKETDALTSMQSAADLISQGGVAASAGRRALAKAFNSGAMTDQDVADIAGGKSLLQRGTQLAETALSGDLTPDNEKELLNIADTLIPAMQKKINDRADVAAGSFSNIYTNVPKAEVLKILNPAGIGGAGIKSSDAEMREFFKKNNIPPEAQAAAGAAFMKAKAKKQQVRN